MVVLAKGRCGIGVKRPGPAGEAHRHGAEPSPAVNGVFDLLEEAAKRQLVQLRLTMGLHDLGHRHAGIPEGCDDVVSAAALAPGGQPLVDQVVPCAPAGGG